MALINLEKINIRPKKTVNIVFVGHVDSGKSTICGRILVDLKWIDERVLEKYKKQSEELNRASWYLSWCMDINPEERERGKTVETGTAYFDLPNTRVNILDAPGHKQFVQEMIDAASQADVGVLIVSARTGEFEVGMSGGQTKEHTILLKLGGIENLVILVNKMDEVAWDKVRYEQISKKILAYTQKKFESVTVIPISGMGGENLTKRHECDLYDGPSFLEFLDSLEIKECKGRENMCVTEKVKTSGSAYIYCKVNSGSFCVGEEVLVLPSGRTETINEIATEADIEIDVAVRGETYKVRMKGGIDEIGVGNKIVKVGNTNFKGCRELFAEILIIDPAKPVTVGYTAIIHLGNQSIGAKITDLRTLDKKRALVAMKREKYITKLLLDKPIVVESNEKKKERFSLRDESFTVASGIILKIINKSDNN